MDIGPAITGSSSNLSRSNTPPQSETNASAITSDFETFLKMLTAQIQNQDPLQPTPSDEFAVQLATFSSVEQQVQTNDLLQALSTQFSAMGMAEFATWVGMEGRAAAPAQFNGAPITLSPNPDRIADSAELVVRNADGREVERTSIPVSTDPIQWAGVDANGNPYPDGAYSFELVSFSEGSPIASDDVEVYGRIVEARGEGGRTVLVFDSGAIVPANDVTALRQPQT